MQYLLIFSCWPLGDEDSDDDTLLGEAQSAAAQAAYDRDRATRKEHSTRLVEVPTAFEIDNTDAEQVGDFLQLAIERCYEVP